VISLRTYLKSQSASRASPAFTVSASPLLQAACKLNDPWNYEKRITTHVVHMQRSERVGILKYEISDQYDAMDSVRDWQNCDSRGTGAFSVALAIAVAITFVFKIKHSRDRAAQQCH
jgi:hypothetical protein